MGFTPNQFAFVAGAAINDTSSVAGAQATYQSMIGDASFQGALNVKLVRTTMLIFVALAWTFIVAAQSKKDSAASQNSNIFSVIQKSFPMFILWFVLMAGV